MFTGIVEEKGKIKAINKSSKSCTLKIEAKKVLTDLKVGDSVLTNGVCLTATSVGDSFFTADVMSETLSRTSFLELRVGSFVNLERAMAVNSRFGGHIVTGHIDGVGKIIKIQRDDIAVWYTVKVPPEILKYIIEKGSVAIDGISLTVAKVLEDSFEVSIIPHTLKNTILSEKNQGSIVNIENDVIGKYVEKFVLPQSKISKEFLFKNGF